MNTPCNTFTGSRSRRRSDLRPLLAVLGFALATLTGFSAPAGVPPHASLLPAQLNAMRPTVNTDGDATLEVLPVQGQPFTNAWRVSTLRKPAFPWHVRLTVPTTGPIRQGDTLLASIQARRVESRQETGEALVELIVEEAAADHQKLLEFSASAGPQWTTLSAPFVAHRDFPAGAAQLSLRFGYQPQAIEVGEVQLLNFGPNVALASLPRSGVLYSGCEPDAPWRKEALARIERIRKGDLSITVTNAAGQPLAGIPVKVRMVRHAFTFGTAITAHMLTSPAPDAARYREVFLQHFNKAVFENDLKWPAWQDTASRGVVLQAVDWLRERRIPIRGHVMVWPSWHNLPQNIGALRDRPDELRKAIEDHIRDQTRTLRGKIDEWDVINESYAHNDAIKLLGREVMVDWFKIAHEGDPAVKLFYNDYIMFWGDGPGSPSQYFYETIQFLKGRGAPIHGIGEQGHFGGNPANPASVLATFDRFGGLGLPIQISEFDIDTSNQDVKNGYTRDFMIAAFSHPAVTGVMMWGFWEGRHWKPRAALWNRDWSLRPHGQVWVDLVKKQWWTNAEGRTDASGQFRVRGYCGEYEVTSGGGPAARVTLANQGASLHVRGE